MLWLIQESNKLEDAIIEISKFSDAMLEKMNYAETVLQRHRGESCTLPAHRETPPQPPTSHQHESPDLQGVPATVNNTQLVNEHSTESRLRDSPAPGNATFQNVSL